MLQRGGIVHDGRSIAPSPRGRFQIRGIVGGGPLGTVFRCWDPRLDRELALKVLRSDLFDGDRRRGRLKAACLQASRLSHPGLVRLLEFHVENGSPSFAMHFVDGLDLRRWRAHRIERGRPFDLWEIVRLIDQVAPVLDLLYAVFPGHGLLKASNLIAQPGIVRIGDYHLAAALDPEGMATLARRSRGPCYLAPELGLGVPLSPAADVYSLAAVAVELLTGTVPGAGVRPRLGSVRPDLPAAVAVVLGRALDEDPSVRPPTPWALGDSLAGLEESLAGFGSPRGRGAAFPRPGRPLSPTEAPASQRRDAPPSVAK